MKERFLEAINFEGNAEKKAKIGNNYEIIFDD